MKITVTTHNDDIFVLEVSEDIEMENFKAFCEMESGFPANQLTISFNGKLLLDDKKSLKEYGVSDGDVVVLLHLMPRSSDLNMAGNSQASSNSASGVDFSSITVPPSFSMANWPSVLENPNLIREIFMANSPQLAMLKQNNPALADALISGNLEAFTSMLRGQAQAKTEHEQQLLKIMTSGPFDTEAQRLISEEIRKKNIDANMEAALEHNPETFGTVVMLYINCQVNGIPVKAFIDSGAQTTIMSASCAERCNVMRLIDTRWTGVAKGVGVQKIIGRIHMVQVRIDNGFMTTSFSVLEEQPMDVLLGLDMLKRHQCIIDLRRNVLQIGTTGTETPFLSESELPEYARLSGAIEN